MSIADDFAHNFAGTILAAIDLHQTTHPQTRARNNASELDRMYAAGMEHAYRMIVRHATDVTLDGSSLRYTQARNIAATLSR